MRWCLSRGTCRAGRSPSPPATWSRRALSVPSLPFGSPSSLIPTQGPAAPPKASPLGPAIADLVSATAGKARNTVATRALPDHPFPGGKIRRDRCWMGSPAPQLALHFIPHSQAVIQTRTFYGVRGVRHLQSFGSKFWNEGQLTDFQELCLQKKQAQRTDTSFQALLTAVLSPWGSDDLAPPKKTQAASA